MIYGFWGLQVLPNKAYTQTVDASFRLSMASLGEEIVKANERTLVKLTVDQKTFVLCSLLPGKVEQQTLDVIFSEGEEITFFVSGENSVHLTGNYMPDEEDYNEDGDSEDEDCPEDCSHDHEADDSDEEGIDISSLTDEELAEVAKENKMSVEELKNELAKFQEADDDDEDMLDSEDEDLSVEELAAKYGVSVEDLKREMEAEDSDDEDGKIVELGEGSDSEEDADYNAEDHPEMAEDHQIDEEIDEADLKVEAAKVVEEAKAPINGKAKAVETPTMTKKERKAAAAAASAASTPAKAPATPAAETPAMTKKERKAAAAAAAAAAASATPSAASTPAKPAEDKKRKVEETPNKSDSSKAAKKAKETTAAATPAKKETTTATTPAKKETLAGGLIIEDIKVGSGAAARKGQRVGMRYVGKLQKNGKVFDKCTSGKPFSFRLGAGEVIKGWDQGIAGMKEGGERRLTIPAPLAYGRQGAAPDIPANATLVFDVKLVNLK
ncbi:peptidylprolyl isomerase fpr3 [Tieghemiomyces parasiticus]|uniref:peptidylprolyl isomerase n=1 Tax=Tieghemiomyces parasiticus TaxID=78921 RepID=A0A9W8A883_9FUNG|nr:peptidylprolyl isomerase fpr3 [Tieghemiomyces parasiticus]